MGEVTINTERHVFVLSLSAKIVGAEIDGENVAPAAAANSAANSNGASPEATMNGGGMEEEEGSAEKAARKKAVAEPAVPFSGGTTVELDENATLADMKLRVDAAAAQA